MRPLVLLLLITSAAHAQAPAMRPVPRPPAMTPGYNPGTPPEPVHTPSGAGASHGGLAAPVKDAHRSTNKRPLPDEYDPRKEPGVWNVDGAPAAGDGQMFGVSIPLPQHPPIGAKEILSSCAAAMTSALRAIRAERLLDAMEPTRACMAARAYLHCVLREGAEPRWPQSRGPAPLWTPRTVRLMVQPLAERLAQSLCAGVKMDEDEAQTLDAILRRYTWAQNELDQQR